VPKHEKFRRTVSDGDTLVHTTESYHESLTQIKVEREKHIKTSKQTVLKDLIECLEHITDGQTNEMTIKIRATAGHPDLLTKIWTESRQTF